MEPSGSIASTSVPQVPEDFLLTLDYKVQNHPDTFAVEVPQNWEVKLGEYPVGLYWRLANEFSKDAGLDLTLLKGATVEVQRYSLVDGLPGSGEQKNFLIPPISFCLCNQEIPLGLGWNLIFKVSALLLRSVA